MDMDPIWSHLLAFFTGLGSGVAVKVFISNRINRHSKNKCVLQKGNSANGDIVAGDKITKS